MKSPSDSIAFVHVSLRIPISLKTSLEKDAKRQRLNFNSQVANILEKYTSFDKIAEHVGAVQLNGQLFSGMLEDVPIEHLEVLGKQLGPRLIKHTFAFLDLEYNLDGLISHYFEPMSTFSRWYTFTVVGRGSNRKLMFSHPQASSGRRS